MVHLSYFDAFKSFRMNSKRTKSTKSVRETPSNPPTKGYEYSYVENKYFALINESDQTIIFV